MMILSHGRRGLSVSIWTCWTWIARVYKCTIDWRIIIMYSWPKLQVIICNLIFHIFHHQLQTWRTECEMNKKYDTACKQHVVSVASELSVTIRKWKTHDTLKNAKNISCQKDAEGEVFRLGQLRSVTNKMWLLALILHVHKSGMDTFNVYCMYMEMLIVDIYMKITSFFAQM